MVDGPRHPANTGNSFKAVLMLTHRLRCWPNIETTLGECPVFAGKGLLDKFLSNNVDNMSKVHSHEHDQAIEENTNVVFF